MSQDPFLKKSQALRNHLIRAASGSFFARVAFMALNLAVAVSLARLLGAKGFGVYSFCLAAAHLMAVPAMLGMQQLVVREFASYSAAGSYGLMRGLLRRARQSVLLTSSVLMLFAGALSYFTAESMEALQLSAFWTGLLLVPLFSLLQLHNSALRGLRWIVSGQMGQVLQLVITLIIVGALYLFLPQGIRPHHAVAAQAAGAAAGLAALLALLHQAVPVQARIARPEFQTKAWLQSAWPMLLAGGAQILNNEISIVMLGALSTAEETGFFRVAQRGATLVLFGLQATVLTIAPTVSSLHSNGQMQLLQEILTKSTRAALAYALPAALFLMIGGFWIIPLIFGKDFAPAAWPLILLCAGQLFNSAAGPVGLVLTMTGNERLTAKGITLGAIANIFLNAFLVPLWGATGAAAATAVSIALWNIILAIWLYKKLGITTTAIEKKRSGRN